ncbi:hypothetical protein Q8A73_017972 [Channa argus]|nr:hypothetical protein Q8A73_017972 [Channa argus]
MMDGGSVHRLHSFLVEQHTAEWMMRATHYLLTCSRFEVPEVDPLPLPPLPKLQPVPTTMWLLAAYVKESFSRIDELRAKVTSTFGSLLNMTSSKKVTTKLAGADAGTAHCMSSVGNELG